MSPRVLSFTRPAKREREEDMALPLAGGAAAPLEPVAQVPDPSFSLRAPSAPVPHQRKLF